MSHDPPLTELALSATIVVPVHESERQLAALVPRIAAWRGGLADPAALEVVMVNDASRDRSWEAVRSAVDQHPWIRGVDLVRNAGQHAALLCGAFEARHEIVVTMDDDLRHPPERVPTLLAAFGAGVDLVYGTPTGRGPIGLRRVGSFAARLALAARAAAPAALHSTSFRAFRSSMTRRLSLGGGGVVNIDRVLLAATRGVALVRVEHGDVRGAPSRYDLRGLLGATGAVVRGGRREVTPLFEVRERCGGPG
ncbi:MAG: glycosyltransferase [Planctomycetota bacterium]|nr:glycosyltransferase [Planctomycetota bacterium]